MTIKQISVFLENKSGRLNHVTKVLADAGINLDAFCIAETTDFGLLRLIVSDVDKAVEVLRKADVAVILTDVVCMECGNTPGSLAAILAALAERGIFIEYMYAFSQEETTAKVIIRPNDLKACTQVLSELELA